MDDRIFFQSVRIKSSLNAFVMVTWVSLRSPVKWGFFWNALVSLAAENDATACDIFWGSLFGWSPFFTKVVPITRDKLVPLGTSLGIARLVTGECTVNLRPWSVPFV